MAITRTATITRIRMTDPDPAALLALHAWLSPAFPVGAFAWSHGLEAAVEAGEAKGREALEGWISDLLAHGAARSDAILLAMAWREPEGEAEALAAALQPSAERRAESLGQGAAFARVAAEAWGAGPGAPCALPVAVGRAARARGLPLAPVLRLYLQSFAANQVSAGIRLGCVGETDGQRILAALGPLILRVAAEAEGAGEADLGGAALRADLAAMLHETQVTRLFRS